MMTPMRFKLFSRRTLRGRRWYFHAQANNNRIILQSQSYRNHDDALETIGFIREHADIAMIDDSEYGESHE